MRFALVVGLLLAAVTTAHADWVSTRVPGTPNDVEVWSPGIFSVSTDQVAWLMAADGGVLASVPTSTAVGTYSADAGCLTVFLENASGALSPGCASPNGIFSEPFSLFRVEATGSGAAYAVARESPDLARLAFTSAARGSSRPWTEGQELVTGVPVALGASRVGSSEHGLLVMRSVATGQVTLKWYVNGVPSVGTYGLYDGGPSSTQVQALDLAPGGGSGPIAFYGAPTGLYRGALADGGVSPFTEVPLPGGSGNVTGVDLNPGVGTVYGDGFGMATVQRPGGAALLSAVPATRPEEVGTQWRDNATLPPGTASPRHLECYGAELCVITQAVDGPNNLLIYTNASAPTLVVEPETFVQEGTTRALPVFVQDGDGDPVRVAVDGGSPLLRVSTQEQSDGGVQLLLEAGDVCGDVVIPVSLTASDGLASHDQHRPVSVRVIHSRSPGAPRIASRNIIVEAGQGHVPLQLSAPVNSPCPIAGYLWSTVPQDAPLSGGDGGLSATFPTPATWCDANGATYLYRVEAIDNAGLVSAPTDFTVQLQPWGAPTAPFPGDQAVSIIAPGGTRLTPQRTHECAEKPGSGFPGVDTLWELRDGGIPDGGVKLLTQDGGLIPGPSVVTPELLLEAQECAGGDLEFSVRHFVRGSPQQAGPPSTVHVTVTPFLSAPADGQLSLSELQPTAAAVAGMASVEGVNCLAERGGVTARISAEPENGGAPIRSGEFQVPGPWLLQLGDLCEGGSYRITGELLPDNRGLEAEALKVGGRAASSGGPQQVVVAVPVTVPPAVVQLKPLEDARLTARCGEVAQGALEQRIPEPCSNLPLSWDYLRGPRLSQDSFMGQRIELATQETDFGALIGESVVLRVSSSTGQVIPHEQPVLITADPFIEVHRRTEKATGTEANLLGVSVELRNTTGCGVSQVDHVELLEGVDYVPGSARFNGAPVASEVEGGRLVVRGLALEGDTTGVLTYVVRPRLLEAARFEGQSSLRGVAISQPVAMPPPGGCGCAGGGSGFAALGLAGLAAVLRRRRAR